MRTSVRRSLIAAMIAVVFSPSMAGDRDMFYRGSVRPAAQMPFVTAGVGVIDEALPRIIPAPYRIVLDDSIPASLYIVWGDGDNWMDVLIRALAPIGLVAQPDWSRNTITVVWRKQPAPAQAAPAPVVDSVRGVADNPDNPAALLPVADKRPTFEVVHPTPHAFTVATAQQAQPAKEPMREAPSAPEDVSPSAAPPAEQREFVVGIADRLPGPSVMWQLMKAVVGGDRLLLTGVSAARDEAKRIRYANTYAAKLRANLLAVGFPPPSVIVVEHDVRAERGDKPGVKILISRG